MTNIENAGKKVGDIPVSISFHIIELFSGGLYSSPNKAFEELVTNAYDAFATKVAVQVPTNKQASDAVLWVCDNGDSMDSNGLRMLWKIGTSLKRTGSYDPKDRPPIGKFGIGKLATYVLARKLSYVCKKDGKYRLVTMDYGRINAESEDPTPMTLEERVLTEDEVKHVLKPYVEAEGKSIVGFQLWGEGAEETWTFALMSDLKSRAADIQDGRLRWILSTALPLSPNFKLLYNGNIIESSKADIAPLKTWIIGQEDQIVEKIEKYEVGEINGKPCVHLPNLRNVHGYVELYNDSLVKGAKSENLGRSHGIFLMVRERLINLDDPLLGMAAMTHGVFNRFRMIIHADELDNEITSTRESIKDSNAFSDLKKYIQRKFDEVRKFYFDKVESEENLGRASFRVSSASAGLSRRPLLVVARRYFKGELGPLVLTDIPDNLEKGKQKEILDALEVSLMSEEGIIKDVVWEALSPEKPIARLDLLNGVAKVNLLHPFIANFLDEIKSRLPFQLIAITEILTEAFMIESGTPQEQVSKLMWRRDQILRDLTFSDKPNAPLVSQMLSAAVSNPDDLEDAVFNAFNSLGYETTKLGGKGKPDGLAVAVLGITDAATGSKGDYSLTYDAKSTIKAKIKATHAHISGVDRHRDDYNAQYAVVVAIDFEGAMGDDSAVNKEAKKNKITLLRANDLITLVLSAAPKQLGFLDFKELFEKCHTVKETSEWIDKMKQKQIEKRPIKELLDAIYKLMKDDIDVIKLAGLRMSHPELKKLREDELRNLVQSLESLVGKVITLNGDVVSIQIPPEKIMERINKIVTHDIPQEWMDIYLQAFDNSPEPK